MAPYEIEKMALKELRKAYNAMKSSRWDKALERKSKEELAKAGKLFLSLRRTIIRLGNKKLSEIREKLIENEDALNEGKKKLDKALKNLTKVGEVLDGVDGFLAVIGEIISFVG